MVLKYSEQNQSWAVDLYSDYFITKITDKNSHIEYVRLGNDTEAQESIGTVLYHQYSKDKIALMENIALSDDVVLDKNIFYSDGGTLNEDLTGLKGTDYTSAVETANHRYEPYG